LFQKLPQYHHQGSLLLLLRLLLTRAGRTTGGFSVMVLITRKMLVW